MLDIPMVAVSTVTAMAALWLVLAFVMTCSERYRRMGVAVVVSLAVTLIVVDILVKPYVGRVRPFEVTDFPLIVPAPTSFSFPSGHTAYAFAAATCIAYYNRKWGIMALVFAAIVGLSRMYLYVHWPTDVLAGAIVGMVIALGCIRFMSRYVPYFRDLRDPRVNP